MLYRCTVYCSMYKYVVVEYQTREHSKAQHSTAQTLHNAAKQVRTDQSTYTKRGMRVHACVRFVFLGHGALDICKSLVCTENVGPSTTSVCRSNPFFFVSDRSGRNRRLREVPCITVLRLELLLLFCSTHPKASAIFRCRAVRRHSV